MLVGSVVFICGKLKTAIVRMCLTFLQLFRILSYGMVIFCYWM